MEQTKSSFAGRLCKTKVWLDKTEIRRDYESGNEKTHGKQESKGNNFIL